ncbi:MAG: DsrE family protein [Planctomycetota bacterium]|nr:DsrE family protein [Planctomycetota bacterium]
MKKVIIINSDIMGSGNSKLGKQIMGSFLRKLSISKNKPDVIILYNTGVKLLTKASGVLDALETLFSARGARLAPARAERGSASGMKGKVDIIACGTCVDFFRLKDKIVVGRISNMQEIVDIMMSANPVITI